MSRRIFEEQTHSELTSERATPDSNGPVWITVASKSGVVSMPLPSRGHVVVGRQADCEVRIDDPSVSRRHAILWIGPRIEVEDLGSRNGTRVRGLAVEAKQRAPIEVGDAINFGTAVLVLQPAPPSDRPRRVLTHGYFEIYLEGECARAQAGGPTFTVGRIRVASTASDALEQLLALKLRTIDQFARYSPGEYEILFLELGEMEALRQMGELMAQIAPLSPTVRTGLAVYPEHGRSPDALIAAAAPREKQLRDAESAPIAVSALERMAPLVQRVATGEINVIILGETGVGKEVMANSIHRQSPRAKKPLLSINCAALSETLLEGELFGYERGAFTGAVQAKPGLLESASGGTVFLDEIGEMALAVQAKLLRVIEQKQVQRIGALKPIPVDVRFIAATHRDLEEEIVRGRFRQDLFFRLNGISLVIPPLRERTDEIEALATRFAERAAKQLNMTTPPQIGSDALDLMRGYAWPGNIRELRNVVERAVLLSNDGRITPAELPLEKMGRTVPVRITPDEPRAAALLTLPPSPRSASSPTGAMPVWSEKSRDRDDATAAIPLVDDEADERDRILDALQRCAGNQTQAAKLLGISRRTLVYRLTEYNLPRPRR